LLKSRIIDRFDTFSHIPHLITPLLVIHGRRDREIPIRHSRALFAHARQHHEDVELKTTRKDLLDTGSKILLDYKQEQVHGHGVRFLSECRLKGGRISGPPKMMLVELDLAHHNSIQSFDLTYDSMDMFFSILERS
jgi:hypothetical protein